jgi:hypothetical protein
LEPLENLSGAASTLAIVHVPENILRKMRRIQMDGSKLNPVLAAEGRFSEIGSSMDAFFPQPV